MRWISFLSLLFLNISCSLYQSDERANQVKPTKHFVTAQGFDSVQNIQFTCFQSASAPDETKGPVEVLDSAYEEQGFSSYLAKEKLIVHRVPHPETEEAHFYCELNTHGDLARKKLGSAINLGVKLLD